MSITQKQLTKPKIPFSNVIDKQTAFIRQQRIYKMKPSKKFHDFHTIQWLRTRYGEKLIQKSIFSLLPDNGKPVIPEDESDEDKKQRLLMEWLETYAQAPDKFKHVNINPKYFFNDKTFEKVMKLKEIFLSFDEDGSRKMEINEMEEMFNANNINVTINELITLFFKNKSFKQEDIMSLYLDFYQFMTFALTKEQDFRLFMRKIKEKYKQSGQDENENGFLPMSFNLMLDYFIIKGKDRASVEIIEKAIDEMDKILINVNGKKKRRTLKRGTTKKSVNIDSENYQNINEENTQISLTARNDTTSNNKENDINGNYDLQLENINFKQLISEFHNLFRIKEDTSVKNGSHFTTKRRGTVMRTPNTRTFSLFPTKRNSSLNVTSLHSPNDISPRNEENNYGNDDMDNNENDTGFYNLLHSQLLKDEIHRMNQSNYEKFHSLHLAILETKKTIADRKQKKKGEKSSFWNNNNSSNANNSTMYATSRILPKIEWNRPISEMKYQQRDCSMMSTRYKQPFLSKSFITERQKKDFVPFGYINKY